MQALKYAGILHSAQEVYLPYLLGMPRAFLVMSARGQPQSRLLKPQSTTQNEIKHMHSQGVGDTC
jgi:hypothetical protein